MRMAAQVSSAFGTAESRTARPRVIVASRGVRRRWRDCVVDWPLCRPQKSSRNQNGIYRFVPFAILEIPLFPERKCDSVQALAIVAPRGKISVFFGNFGLNSGFRIGLCKPGVDGSNPFVSTPSNFFEKHDFRCPSVVGRAWRLPGRQRTNAAPSTAAGGRGRWKWRDIDCRPPRGKRHAKPADATAHAKRCASRSSPASSRHTHPWLFAAGRPIIRRASSPLAGSRPNCLAIETTRSTSCTLSASRRRWRS